MIRKDHPGSRFIVVTTYHGDEDIYKALAAGARGYLLKGMSHFELLEAIRRVHAGSQYLPESVRQSLASRPPSSELSARELQILTPVSYTHLDVYKRQTLFHYVNGSFRVFDKEAGLPNAIVRSIYEDRRATLWVGTDVGLFRLDGNLLVRLHGETDSVLIPGHAIVEDHEGRLWVGGSTGLFLSLIHI